MSVGVDYVAEFDDVGMMYSSENCDFSVNFVHPSLCIDTFLSD